MLVVPHETETNEMHRQPNNQKHYSRKEEHSIETTNSQGEFKCGDYILYHSKKFNMKQK